MNRQKSFINGQMTRRIGLGEGQTDTKTNGQVNTQQDSQRNLCTEGDMDR